MENFSEAIREGLILLDFDAEDMEDVLLNVVEECVRHKLIPSSLQEAVLNKLRDRESLDSTAIGNEVAIPHAYIEGDVRTSIVFVRLKYPQDVRAIDGQPARFLFVLLGRVGRVDTHLNTLATVATAVSDHDLRFTLKEAESEEEILAAFDEFYSRQHPGIGEKHEVSEGLQYTGRLFGGLQNDIRRRWPKFTSDFTDGLHVKSVTAVVFLYFACLAPAVTFGGLMYAVTGQQIGATEMLVATAGCGVVFSLLAGQPMIILGGTGPLLVFTGILYQLCESLQIPFLETYTWVGLWTAVFTLILAATDASCLIRFFTRFTDEIFAALISLIFIVEAVRNIAGYVHQKDNSHDVAFLSLIMAGGTFAVAMMLSRFRGSRYLLPLVREFLADFGPTLAVVLMLCFGLLYPSVKPETLNVPSSFSPSSTRSWLVGLTAAPVWVWFAAAGPALLVTVLVYLDQNITGRLVNNPDHRMKKGEGYHLDLAVVGGLIGICSAFGLPWLVAATVRSLNHVRALATVDDQITASGNRRDEVVHVRETRLTGLLVHVLIGVSLFLLSWLQTVPQAVLYGLFLYMGVVSIAGNQLFERIGLWVMDPDLYPETHYTRRVPIKIIHQFTALQVGCLVVLWIVKASAVGILFPMFIALLVPVRMLAGRWFEQKYLDALDAEKLPEEEESDWA